MDNATELIINQESTLAWLGCKRGTEMLFLLNRWRYFIEQTNCHI